MGMRLRITDFETTGFEPPEAEVIEMGITDLILDQDGSTVGETSSFLYGAARGCPPAVRAVHHIQPGEIDGLPLFDPALMVASLGHPEVWVAHNSAFEQRFLPPTATGPVPWICTYKVAVRLFPDLPSHSNFALYYHFVDQGEIDVDMERAQPAHRAGPDTYVTARNLQVMMGETTIEQMIEWTKMPRLISVLQFGKHKGMRLSEVPYDYLSWLAFKSDMDDDVKWNARQEIDRRSKRS